jgi:uncharacterized protein YbjT (DUF2867 family)
MTGRFTAPRGTILVTGATGNVGSWVVAELLARGERVRAFVRDRDRAAALLSEDVELAVGDFADRDSLRRALAGADRVFLACANTPGQVDYEIGAIEAAKAAGVQRLVKLSAATAAVDSPLLFPRWQGLIERHLQRSGLPAVRVSPGFLMSTLLMSADAIRATGQLHAPAGRAKIAMVHPRDVAAVAAVTLTEDGHDGARHVLNGPRAITYQEIAAHLSEATGRPIEFVDVPDDDARRAMLDGGTPPAVADFLVRLFRALRQGLDEKTSDTVRALTGAEPRGFAEFAREHAAAFDPAHGVTPIAMNQSYGLVTG